MTWLLGGYSKLEVDEKLIQSFLQKTVRKDIDYKNQDLGGKMIQYSNDLK